MTNTSPVTFDSISVGQRVEHEAFGCQFSFGTVTRVWVDGNPECSAAIAGAIWQNENIEITFDDGQVIEVFIQSFNASPMGRPIRFRVID